MFNPKISNPTMSNNIPQMRSQVFQKPFYFGGSQVPVNLGLSKTQFSGSGFIGNAPPKQKNDGKYHTLRQGLTEGKGIRMPLKK